MITQDGHLNVWNNAFPVDQVDWSEFENYKIRAMIVHTRYSTSSLDWNQPIYIDDCFSIPEVAMIHNGVVTQAHPRRWKDLFGVTCSTENDTEILAHLYADGITHPLKIEPSSQACIVLDLRDKSMRWWRNEERPLYYAANSRRVVIGSTKDILLRSGAEYPVSIQRVDSCMEYALALDSFTIDARHIREPREDLQQ
jgi:glutamine phosphoribosylpyrophosphate amidotransferase